MRNQQARRTPLTALLFALAALAAAPAQAQTAAPAGADRTARVAAIVPEIDRMYTELAAKEHLPGLVYGIVLGGKLVHARSLGFANLERKIPVSSSSTEFRIASMSKSFVTMAALQLRDQGKLNLDDPVSNYLPEVGRVRLPTADSPPITIRNLMTMTTGLPEDNAWGDRQMEKSNAFVEQLMSAGLSFSNPPGQVFEYSNLGYILLGKVVTKVAGMRFQDHITQHILLPLGMKNTHWEYSQVGADKLALGYQWLHGAWQREPVLHDGDGAAMAGIITTMEDFSRYVAFHLNAWPARDEADNGPLRRASVREMQLPHAFSGLSPKATLTDGKTPNPSVTFYGYGLGWSRDSQGVVTAGHSGGLPGYGSHFRFAPEHGVAVMAFTNLRYGRVYAPTAKALGILLERAQLGPRPVATSPILATRQRQVAELIQSWDAALGSTITAENFFMDRSREDWIVLARAQFAQIGKVTSVGPIKAENWLRGTFQIVGERGTLDIFFTLTPEPNPKVQLIDIKPAKKS